MLNVFGRLPIADNRGVEVGALKLGGGLSYVNVSHSVSSEYNFNLLPGHDIRASSKYAIQSAMGYQIVAGGEYYLNPSISLGLDMIYLFFNPTVKVEISSPLFSQSSESSSSLNNLIGVFAVRYHF
jgi:outer membrane protein W